ncbi:membrane protein insertion efficiency factor YidD [Polaromonas sp. YR568]|uniref:membrane protein insertion efficiency factor YidD n=1 Tax=Polaromonas sp. YR568 TaxID=1855301 RepID=UPI00398C2312
MLRLIAAGSIRTYQRYLSPHKGYRCAHRAHTGHSSCSEFARKLVLRHGLIALFRALPRQFQRCRNAYALMLAAAVAAAASPEQDPHKQNTRNSCGDACDPTDCISLDCGPCDF